MTGAVQIKVKKLYNGNLPSYLAKYCTKSDLPENLQHKASAVLKGSRMFQPFGTWYNASLGAIPPRAWCPNCKNESDYILLEDGWMPARWYFKDSFT